MDDNKIKTIELVSSLKNGNDEAYNELYRMYYDQMFKIAMMNIESSGNKNVQTAEDIVQESMLKAYQKIDTLKDNANFAGWLCTIVKNKCRDYFDKAYVKHESSFTDEEKTNDKGEKVEVDDEDKRTIFKPDALLDEEAKNEMLHDILNSLSEEQKVVTIMYYFDEFSKQEIADTLGIKVTTVDGRLSTARKNIEKGVLSLEKKEGIKLYNISAIPAIPFFLYLLGKAQISENAVNTVAALHTATKHFDNDTKKESKTESKQTNVKDSSAKQSSSKHVAFPKKAIIGLVAGACVVGGGVAVKNATSYKTFDAFSLIKGVDFSGVNGSGSASAWCEDYQMCQYNGAPVTFTFDKTRNLSNGDTVTLSVEVGDEKEFAKEHGGYIPEEQSMTFTVENLYEYITSPDDVPSSVIDEFKNSIETACNEKIEELNNIENTYITYSDFTYVGDFTKTPNYETDDWHNSLIFVYKIHVVSKPDMMYSFSKEDIVQDYYITFEYSDIAINETDNYYVILPSDIATIGDLASSEFDFHLIKHFECHLSLDSLKEYYYSGETNNYIFNF